MTIKHRVAPGKKLQLAKETLRALTRAEALLVVGGGGAGGGNDPSVTVLDTVVGESCTCPTPRQNSLIIECGTLVEDTCHPSLPGMARQRY